MDLRSKAEKFLEDNRVDTATRARRAFAGNRELALYFIQLGIMRVEQEMKSAVRSIIKNTGETPAPRFRPGAVTGSVRRQPLSARTAQRVRNILARGILDTWVIGDTALKDATVELLSAEIARGNAQISGVQLNNSFYTELRQGVKRQGKRTVGEAWSDDTVRALIENVYGEFRKEAA